MDFGKFNLSLQETFNEEATSSAPWLNADEGIIPVVNKVEVMKASHHGSTNANSEELVNKLLPTDGMDQSMEERAARHSLYAKICSR